VTFSVSAWPWTGEGSFLLKKFFPDLMGQPVKKGDSWPEGFVIEEKNESEHIRHSRDNDPVSARNNPGRL